MSRKAPKLCLAAPTRLFDIIIAHAIDTDNVAMPVSEIYEYLSIRAAKNVRQLRLEKGA